jgi:hypothetical protein
MNKYIISLAFLAHTMLFTQANAAANPFEKLTPSIVKDAAVWSHMVTSTLKEEAQLAFLNLFALSFNTYGKSEVQTFMKCAEYIEAQPEMKEAYELLSNNIMQKIKKYIEGVQAKIAQKKNITKQEEEKFLQKLEAKIQELVAYINAIYYSVLYGNVSKKSTSTSLSYMFDENGVIPQDKRTKSLPQTTSN